MKQLSFSISIFLMVVSTCYSQPEWYVNGSIGPINYVGDLRDRRFTTIGMTPNASIGMSYQPKPHLIGTFSLTAGKIKATDAQNGNKWKYRNLSFQTMLYEASFVFEWDLKDIRQPENSFADQNPSYFTPYMFVGAALFHYNPYTYDISGKKVYLEPLGTEGQENPYSLWQFAIPFGFGGKFALNHTMFLSIEFNVRKTFTDYLDDVSHYHYLDTVALAASNGQEAASLSYRADEIPNNKYNFYDGYRGNPKKKDGYYSVMVKYSYQLFTRKPKFYYGF